ncbi:XRE family transcriptional regulator [Halomonas litopenaei]|nr:XRE family transcriptional regulator [Halomonas litopenaei]
MARPTKYKAEFAEQARKLCLLGATDSELADFFGVAESTINKWKLNHKGFSESIKNGKIMADAEVASRLYERALGYSHPEEKVFNNQGEIVTHQTTKHYPPDTTAAAIWLNNRKPDRWRNKPEPDGQDDAPQPVNVVFKVQDASDPDRNRGDA